MSHLVPKFDIVSNTISYISSDIVSNVGNDIEILNRNMEVF